MENDYLPGVSDRTLLLLALSGDSHLDIGVEPDDDDNEDVFSDDEEDYCESVDVEDLLGEDDKEQSGNGDSVDTVDEG
jgi:hypothetical protein